MINRDNYEVWFVDYYDGKLSPEEQAELLQFLEVNSDLKAEWESFSNIELPESEVKYDGKNSLKRNVVTAGNFEEFAVGYIENTLTAEQREMYLQFLDDNASYKKEHELFARVKLEPDQSVVFLNKESLKHKTGNVIKMKPLWYSAAACLLAAVMVYYNHTPEVQIAEVPVNTTSTVPQNSNHSEQNTIQQNSPIKEKEVTLADVNSSSVKIKQKTVQINNPTTAEATEQHSMIDELAMVQTEIVAPEIELPIKQLSYNTENNIASAEPDKPGNIPEILREMTVKRLNTLAMNQDVDIPDNTKRVKVLALFGRIVNKVTFQKVNIETTYSPEGKLMAYEVTAGKLSFERQVTK